VPPVKVYSNLRQILAAHVKLSVRAAGYGFSGRHPSVWISRSDLAAFLRELRELDRTRRGEARLESMSIQDRGPSIQDRISSI